MIKNINDWPIFVVSENINKKPFWNKTSKDFRFKEDEILLTSILARIGKTK